MLPVTQTSLVRMMGDRRAGRGVPEELHTYLRTEYGGDGADAEWMAAHARSRERSAAPKSSRRGVLSALFEALAAAFPRPGGA